MELTALASFAGIWLAAATSPGGNVAFTVSVSSRYGFAAGLIGSAGFVSALFLYMTIVAYGIGFAVEQFAPLLRVLQVIGVLYLLYLAYRMWNASAHVRLDGRFEAASRLRIYAQGALICLTNPKAVIFVAVVMPQAVDPANALTPQLVLLGATGAMISFVVHSGYSLLGSTLGRSVPSPAARVVVNRIIALVFVIAAIGLGFSNLTGD